MAGSTGRHGRPDEPDDGTVAGEGTGVTPTQPLPTVRRDGPGQEPQPVRAVAKRVPSALPALGREEISDLPSSARANTDRRRRAREAVGEEPEAAAGSDPVVPQPRPEPEIERLPGPSSAPAVSPPVSAEVELVPVGSRSRETPAIVASVEGPAPMGRHAAPAESRPSAQPPAARHASADPQPSTPSGPAAVEPAPLPPPSPPPPPERPSHGQAAGPERPEIIEATVVEEAPRPYAATDAQTDEWVTVPPAAPGPPPPGPAALPAGPPGGAGPLSRGPIRPAPRHGVAGPATRSPGSAPRQPPPPALPGPAGAPDTWETTPLPPVAGDYEGRRRRGRRPAASGWLVVLGVVIALSAAVAVPFLFTAGGGESRELSAEPTTQTSGTASTTVTASATGLPVIPAPSVQPSPSTAAPTSTQPPDATTTTTVATQTSTVNPPVLFSLTLEAESGQRSGCAVVSSVGGVSVVDRLGEENDWPSCWRDGVVRFSNVSLPAGTFTVTVYYVFGQTNSDQSRYARLRIDPPGSGNTIDFANTYPRTTTCCQSWTTPNFTLATAGTFEISFTNPGTSDPNDRAPALHRIVIQQQ